MEELKKIEEAVQKHCGEGKRFKTISDMIKCCNDTVEALGPMAMINGGMYGVRFCVLIPILEEMQKENEATG